MSFAKSAYKIKQLQDASKSTSDRSDKELVKFTKCYDEIDQIYDYIRGLAPLPSRLRKIKSIDFELLEQQQKEKLEKLNRQNDIANRKYSIPTERQHDQTSLDPFVSCPDTNVPTDSTTIAPKKIPLLPKRYILQEDDDADIEDSAFRKRYEEISNNGNKDSNGSIKGPLPLRLTTSSAVARRPLVKRVESLNLTLDRRPRQVISKTAKATDSQEDIEDDNNRNKEKVFRLPRAHSTSILNKTKDSINVPKISSQNVNTNDSSSNNITRSKQIRLPSKQQQRGIPTVWCHPSIDIDFKNPSARSSSGTFTPIRKSAVPITFKPLPPVPNDSSTNASSTNATNNNNLKKPTSMNQQRRQTALGIEHESDEKSSSNKIVPYGLSHFDHSLDDVPHIDDNELESSTTISSFSSSNENNDQHHSHQTRNGTISSNPDRSNTHTSSNIVCSQSPVQDNSEHIYEALDHNPPKQCRTRFPNSVSDLQSFSSNSYVSTNSPSRFSENEETKTNRFDKDLTNHRYNKSSTTGNSNRSLERYHHASKVNGSRKIEQDNVPSTRLNASSTTNSSSRKMTINNNEEPKSRNDLQMKKNAKSRQSADRFLNLIGLNSPNASNSSSSRKSSAISSIPARERRSSSSGTLPGDQLQKQKKPVNSDHSSSSRRTNLTSPIAAMFVVAASALKRTPTPIKDENGNQSRFSNNRVNDISVRHYKHPVMQVTSVPNYKRHQTKPRVPTDGYKVSSDNYKTNHPKQPQQVVEGNKVKKSISNSDTNSSTSSYEAAIKNSSSSMLRKQFNYHHSHHQDSPDPMKKSSLTPTKQLRPLSRSSKLNIDETQGSETNNMSSRALIKVPKLSKKSHLLKPIPNPIAFIDR